MWIPPDMAAHVRRVRGAERVGREETGVLAGPELSNLEYGVVASVLGRCVYASEACNCQAPDTGNMELLARCVEGGVGVRGFTVGWMRFGVGGWVGREWDLGVVARCWLFEVGCGVLLGRWD